MVRELAGIRFTQVGDPLAHRKKGFLHRISSDRSLLAVSEGEDKEVGDLVVMVGDITEGWMALVLNAEAGPDAKGDVLGSSGLGPDLPGGEVERSAQISCEVQSGGRWSSFQGSGCGYSCSKWVRMAESERCWRREASSAMALAGPGM